MAFSSSSSSLTLPSSLLLSKPTTKSSPSSSLSVSLKTHNSFSIFFEKTKTYNKSAAAAFRLVPDFAHKKVAKPDAVFSLFVSNIPFHVDSPQLAKLFETTGGNVEMVEVVLNKNTGKSNGYAFVTMSTVEEAKAAAQMFNGYELDGRPMKVKYGPPSLNAIEVKHEPSPPPYPPPPPKIRSNCKSIRGFSIRRCYVDNLPWDVDEEALQTLFNQAGKVLKIQIAYNKKESGMSRAIAFVTYGKYVEVQNAIATLNGVHLYGQEIRVTRAVKRDGIDYHRILPY